MTPQELKARCNRARQLDIVSYLSALGHTPAKINHFDYWYLSPLRNEKTPSFKVNRSRNLWYDHGIGQGGNLIDFAILYNNCTVGEFLKTLQNHIPLHAPFPKASPKALPPADKPIQIIQEGPIQSYPLQRYLHQRRIPVAVANRFCREIQYTISDKHYFAIGFPNRSGGYELRNAFFKGSTAPKDVTLFEKNKNEVAVFEGFFDFLSYFTIYQKPGSHPKQFPHPQLGCPF